MWRAEKPIPAMLPPAPGTTAVSWLHLTPPKVLLKKESTPQSDLALFTADGAPPRVLPKGLSRFAEAAARTSLVLRKSRLSTRLPGGSTRPELPVWLVPAWPFGPPTRPVALLNVVLLQARGPAAGSLTPCLLSPAVVLVLTGATPRPAALIGEDEDRMVGVMTAGEHVAAVLAGDC